MPKIPSVRKNLKFLDNCYIYNERQDTESQFFKQARNDFPYIEAEEYFHQVWNPISFLYRRREMFSRFRYISIYTCHIQVMSPT